ncbi:MAG: SDR family oxidoreductase [Gammaproteobacteria bacterium]|nr:SDR family oxidoreductase [Gammaproteobacteria bacterium]
MTAQAYPRPGTTALVTGAGSGIGAATATALVDIGCRVICSGRRLDQINTVSERLGDTARAVTLDVTDDYSVDSLYDRLPRGWDEIDILVNNAGHDVGGRRRFDQGTMAQWASIIETNVIGLIRVTRKVIEGMLQRDSGHIVNIGSTAGFQPYATGTIYSGSKHAVHGFSESLRMDYADTGVRVTEICPGLVRTEFAQTRWDDAVKAKEFYQQHGTSLQPEDVARTVVFALQQPPHVVISQLVVVPTG